MITKDQYVVAEIEAVDQALAKLAAKRNALVQELSALGISLGANPGQPSAQFVAGMRWAAEIAIEAKSKGPFNTSNYTYGWNEGCSGAAKAILAEAAALEAPQKIAACPQFCEERTKRNCETYEDCSGCRSIHVEAAALETPKPQIEAPKEGEVLEPRYSDRCWREVPPIDRETAGDAEAAKGEGE